MSDEVAKLQIMLGVYRTALKEEFLNPDQDWGKNGKPSEIVLVKIKEFYQRADKRYHLPMCFCMLKELTWPTLSDPDGFIRHLCQKAHELIFDYEREYGRL
jgi:hypothetical protein